MATSYRASIYNNGQFIEQLATKGRKLPKGSDWPFQVNYQKSWWPATFDAFGNLKVDIGLKPAAQPRRTPTPPRHIETATKPDTPAAIDELEYSWIHGMLPEKALTPYEAWKAGRTGHGPKVTAPRGLGQEWAARLYCEQAIERMSRPIGRTRRQLRAGSKESRRLHTGTEIRSGCWAEALATARAVYDAPIPAGLGGCWQAKKELIQDALQYASENLRIWTE